MSWKREIVTDRCRAHPAPDMESRDPAAWLQSQALELDLDWLLVHADDGLLWGRREGERLVTTFDAAGERAGWEGWCPALRPETLQQARLFGRRGELLLWRDGQGGWGTRLLRSAGETESADWDEAYEERQLLWGNACSTLELGFTLWRDGGQGLVHGVPITATPEQRQPPRLVVRHYLTVDGPLRVAVSRLYDLVEE